MSRKSRDSRLEPGQPTGRKPPRARPTGTRCAPRFELRPHLRCLRRPGRAEHPAPFSPTRADPPCVSYRWKPGPVAPAANRQVVAWGCVTSDPVSYRTLGLFGPDFSRNGSRSGWRSRPRGNPTQKKVASRERAPYRRSRASGPSPRGRALRGRRRPPSRVPRTSRRRNRCGRRSRRGARRSGGTRRA
jgi:hypothetical protein